MSLQQQQQQKTTTTNNNNWKLSTCRCKNTLILNIREDFRGE
jgi:hypothetical protein